MKTLALIVLACAAAVTITEPAAANVAEQARVPLISPTSTNPQTTEDKTYVFRVSFIDTFQGRVMAQFAAEDLGAQRAAVLYDIASEYNQNK